MIFPKCFQNCNPFLRLEILTLNLKENRPVIDNHITDSKSSTNKPPCPTSLGNRGNRNNWDVYGLQNMLCCHHLQSDTRRFTYHPLTYTSHCFIVYICWMNSCRRWSNWSGHRCNHQLPWSLRGHRLHWYRQGCLYHWYRLGSLYQNPGSPGTNRKVRGFKLWG